MEDVKAAIKGRGHGRCGERAVRAFDGRGRWRDNSRWRRSRVRIAEEQKDVPNAELGCERDGVIEEGEVPTCSVGGG